LQSGRENERRKVMIRGKESNAKRTGIPSKEGMRSPTHTLRGVWESTNPNVGQYRLILSCSLRTGKK
jgi:hypothetical protein